MLIRSIRYYLLKYKKLGLFNLIDYVYGFNSTIAVLAARKRKVNRLFINSNNPRIQPIIQMAQQRCIQIKPAQKTYLDKITNYQPHQGVVIQCDLYPIYFINPNNRQQILQTKHKNIWLLINRITDPQNLGAIIRTAYFFGINGIIIENIQVCPLNQTVAKTSSGSLDLVDIFHVQNSQQFLKCRQENWLIVSTGFPQNPLKQVRDLSEVQIQKYNKHLIIVGSEGKGVYPHLVRGSEYCTVIGGNMNEGFVQSLNVNAATAIILHEYNRRIHIN